MSTTHINLHEQAGRTAKIARLQPLIIQLAEAEAGRKIETHLYAEDAELVAEAIRVQLDNDEFWRKLAAAAGVIEPSTTTKAVIHAMYADQAARLDKAGKTRAKADAADPFAGLGNL